MATGEELSCDVISETEETAEDSLATRDAAKEVVVVTELIPGDEAGLVAEDAGWATKDTVFVMREASVTLIVGAKV